MKDKFYYKDGSILNYWYHTKILHREDGPAIEYANGYKVWFIDGKKYRVDGPAIEWANDSKYWYINDVELTEEEFNNHPKVQNYRFQLLLEEVLSEE